MQPPHLLRRIVRSCLPYEDREPLLAELDALFDARLRAGGRRAAIMWYSRQAAGFVFRVGLARLIEAGTGHSLRSDARVALRSFRRRPVFVAAFALTLAVSTGVLATVYTAARWVLLRPVPGVARLEQLTTLRLGSSAAPPHVSFEVSHPDFITLRDRLASGSAIAASTPIDVDLRPAGGDPIRVAGAMVTSNYFAVLGARIGAGRTFMAEEDDRPIGQPAAVLSHSLARRLGSELDILGRDIRVNGTPVRVVGVTAPGFRGASLPGRDEIWLPLSALTIIDPAANPQASSRRGYGLWRLMIARSAVTLSAEAMERAASEVMEAVRSEFRTHSYAASHFRFQAFPGIGLDPAVRASVRRTLSQLGVVAALLFLLAMANLVNLALIESAARSVNTAIRSALGASWIRLARGAFAETALLAGLGTIMALGLAFVWSRWYQSAQLSEYGAALAGMRIDLRIALFTVLVAFAAAGVAFIGPASSAGVSSIEQVLRRGTAGGLARQRLRSALVSVQVALSLMLLIAAGLLDRTVANLREIDLGFRPERLLTFSLDPHLHGYESARLDALARGLEVRLAQEPSALAAGFVSPSPLRSGYFTASLYASDNPDVRPVIGAGFYVTPGFLEALGVRTIAGQEAWRADSATVVISRGTLTKLLPGVPPAAAIGRAVPTGASGRMPVRVVAVIEDVQLSDITTDPPPVIFRPLAERPRGLSLSGFVLVRRAPMSMAGKVQRIVGQTASDLPVFDMRSARAAVDLQFADRKAMARVASTLSAVGLLLAAIGLYGVLAAVVASRRREIGIRGALGAAPGRILQRVVRDGYVPVLAGLGAGLAGAVLVNGLLGPQLFGLDALDPVAVLTATGLVMLASGAAAMVPAYRAVRVSPAEVLRED